MQAEAEAIQAKKRAEVAARVAAAIAEREAKEKEKVRMHICCARWSASVVYSSLGGEFCGWDSEYRVQAGRRAR